MTDQTTNPGAPGSTGPSTSSTTGTTATTGSEDRARTEAERAADEARNRGQAIADEARQGANRLAAGAQSVVEEKAEEYKGQAAGELNRMATALRDAGDDLRQGSPQERAISSMADNLADAADAFANRDLGSLMADASAFARRNPTAFLGGAALLGFAAARFAKASQRDSYSSYGGTYRGYQSYDEPTTTGGAPAATSYGSTTYPGPTSVSTAGSTAGTSPSAAGSGSTGGTSTYPTGTNSTSSVGGSTAGSGSTSTTTGTGSTTTGAGTGSTSTTGASMTGTPTAGSTTTPKSSTPAHSSEDD